MYKPVFSQQLMYQKMRSLWGPDDGLIRSVLRRERCERAGKLVLERPPTQAWLGFSDNIEVHHPNCRSMNHGILHNANVDQTDLVKQRQKNPWGVLCIASWRAWHAKQARICTRHAQPRAATLHHTLTHR